MANLDCDSLTTIFSLWKLFFYQGRNKSHHTKLHTYFLESLKNWIIHTVEKQQHIFNCKPYSANQSHKQPSSEKVWKVVNTAHFK